MLAAPRSEASPTKVKAYDCLKSPCAWLVLPAGPSTKDYDASANRSVLLHGRIISGLQALLKLFQLVLHLPALLVAKRLLEVFDLFLPVLVAERSLRLHVDLVSRGIIDFLYLLVPRSLLLFLVLLGFALDAKVSALHDPFLCGDAVAELLVVADDQDATLVILDRQDEGAEALPVEVVSGFVEDEDVGVLPHGRPM